MVYNHYSDLQALSALDSCVKSVKPIENHHGLNQVDSHAAMPVDFVSQYNQVSTSSSTYVPSGFVACIDML